MGVLDGVMGKSRGSRGPYRRRGGLGWPGKSEADQTAADELILFMDNDEPLYRRKMSAFVPSVKKKIKSGKYDAAKAPKLWIYLLDEAAKKYTKEYGSGQGYGSFTKSTRELAAKEVAKREYQAIKNGEYD